MFEFSQEHQMVRKMLRRWVDDNLEPQVDAIESGAEPYDLMRHFAKTFGIAEMARSTMERLERKHQARETGADAVQGPKGEGGRRGGGDDGGGETGAQSGLDPALVALMALELSRSCPGFMLAFGASMGLAGAAIMKRGTMEQKRRWALPILSVEKIGAWGITEPGAGSDAFRSMRTVAVPVDGGVAQGGGYILNGQKTFITNAPYADILIVYVKIDHGDGVPLERRPIEAFVLEKGDAGLSVSEPMKKMGMNASPTGEIFLEDCRVSADRLLGMKERASGRDGGRDAFHTERSGMAPMCVGIIERCLEICTDYAKEREAWGRKISEYQLVQEKLARMYMHLKNVEGRMFKQIWMAKEGRRMSDAEASAAKLYCARATTECALEAVQLLGGNGYMREYRVEMLMRDAKLLQIGGGTDEIQIANIARALLM